MNLRPVEPFYKNGLHIPIDTPLIDSFKLSIPIENVQFINKDLLSRINIYYVDSDNWETDLEEEFLPPKPYKKTIDGISLRFQKVMRMRGSDGTQKEFLMLTVSSKLLKGRYFQGLNIHNIYLAYEFLMALKQIKFSFETFLYAHVSDINICFNFRCTPLLFLELIDDYKSDLKQGCDRFFQPHTQKSKGEFINLGLSLNSRDKGTPARPYVKFYNKEAELKSKKTLPFFEKFLEKHNPDIKDLFRLEYTIKGYKHKERLLDKNYMQDGFNTLKELLSIPVRQLEKICLSFDFDYFRRYEINTVTKKDVVSLSPTQLVITDLMIQLIERGASDQEIYRVISRFGSSDKDRKKKSTTKSLITKMLDHAKNSTLSVKKQSEKNTKLFELKQKLRPTAKVENTED